MSKKESASLISGTFFMFVIIFSAAADFLGIIPFLFSKRLIDYAGIFLILTVLCFAYFVFSFLSGRENISKKLSAAVKAVCAVFSAVFVLFGALLTLFMSENLIKRNVSPDKNYEAYVIQDETFGGWNVTVYERLGPCFKAQRGSLYIEDMAYSDGDMDILWEDGCCSIGYEYYPDLTTQNPERKTQKIYFDGRL